MIINQANMDGLFQTYRTAFTDGMRRAQTRPTPNSITLEELALVLPVRGASTMHAWIEQIRAMREWVGDRVIANIKLGKLTVVNRPFENTISVPRSSIEDDEYGVFAPLIGIMGDDAEGLWLRLAVDALLGNGTWADEKPFFCANRVLGASTITNAVTTALSAAAIDAAVAAMGGYTLHAGEPAEVTPVYLVVGPSLESTGRRIVEADMVSEGGVSVSNIQRGRLTLRVSPRFVGTHATKWAVLGKKSGLSAVGVQKRKAPELTRLDRAFDEPAFMRGEYLYGTEARGEAFLTLPFLAYMGGLSEVTDWAA